MRSTLKKSLKNLKWIKTQRNRMTAVLLVLSILVSLNVALALRQPGLTLAGDAACGIQEHTHDENCGVQMCVCGFPEDMHVHDASCYETRSVDAQESLQLLCQETEQPHEHHEGCYQSVVTEAGTQTVLVCENEDAEHSHEDGCYETIEIPGCEETVLVCDLVSEPHEHAESCYAVEVIEAYEEQILICGIEACEHVHEEACYSWEMTCSLPEHVHSVECYSDESADVETPLDWEKMFEDYPYSGDLREDLVGIACTQVGYAGSKLNFELDSDGVRHGYTRYGAWYGAPYKDWSAMFVSFCLNYAGADSDEVPGNTGASSMAKAWDRLGKYAPAEEYIPVEGDLVFLKGNAVGIVADVRGSTFDAICGDIDDAVSRETFSLTSSSIKGWGITVGTVPTAEETLEPTLEPTAEPTVDPATETTAEPTTEPTAEPTPEVTAEPTAEPTAGVTVEPTEQPAVPEGTEMPVAPDVPKGQPDESAEPGAEPTAEPTPEVTAEPTTEPTAGVTSEPTEQPVVPEGTEMPVAPDVPKGQPDESAEPGTEPTVEPTVGPSVEPTVEPAVEPTAEPESPGFGIGRTQLLDISNGPAVFIFAGDFAGGLSGDGESQEIQRFTLRAPRATDLLAYLNANGGGYFFTLLDHNNQELPKDANGSYIVQPDTGYKLTISFTNPKGFLPGTYQYQVPNGLLVDGGEGSFILQDGTNVGSWVVTDTGLITMVFNEEMNSRTDITISATLGIHFPATEDPIDFDGKITVTVQKPPVQEEMTKLNKWGNPGSETEDKMPDSSKIYWTVLINGKEGSHIPGSTLTDQTLQGDDLGEHSYTRSDMEAGIKFGADETDPVTGESLDWHEWTVYPGDPNLTWTADGWSYAMPQTVVCKFCGELPLGNNGWNYYINYTSTPDPAGDAGTFYYMNRVTVDNQYAEGGTNFTHGVAEGEILKYGDFVADAGGGAFVWEIQATVPGRQEGERAKYFWYIMDYMSVLDDGGNMDGRAENDANLSRVTARYNGSTITVPRLQDADGSSPFAWYNEWSPTSNDGITYGRQINLLCRCTCTEETCRFWNNGCDAVWFEGDDGKWYTNGYCHCWTVTGNTTFTFTYKTEDLSVVEKCGGMGYKLQNQAELYYKPNGGNEYVLISDSRDSVPIPGLFSKELTDDFNGYTASYEITVNEAKLPLTNGAPLNIRDEMTQTLVYISGSLVITSEDANGNRLTLQQGTDYTVAYDGTGSQTDENGRPVHVLDIVILRPQPVMYILDYDTTLIIPPGATEGVKYSNSATVTLWGEDMTDTSVEKVFAEINIAAKSFSVEMYKTSNQTGEPLPGATFGLYNAHGGQITSDVTDANGELKFATNIIEGIILREHVLYYMQELKAPAGYRLDDTKYWFCFCDSKSGHCATCDQVMAGVDALRIPFEQLEKIHATNEVLSYNLPATGGPGIYVLMLASVTCIVTSLVLGCIRRRKRERRGVR